MPERAILFINGELPDAHALKAALHPSDWLVAVDGGLRHALKLGLTPHQLIGDLDSVTPDQVEQMRMKGVEIRQYPVEKDETDLELALFAALEKGCTIIRLVAGLGGRLDHTLGNLGLLLHPDLQQCDLRFEDGIEEALMITHSVEIRGTPGDVISLLPFQGEVNGITTQNLKYPLNNETLHPYKTRGISNIMLAVHCSIQITSGCLLCIHTHQTQGVS